MNATRLPSGWILAPRDRVFQADHAAGGNVNGHERSIFRVFLSAANGRLAIGSPAEHMSEPSAMAFRAVALAGQDPGRHANS